MPSLPLSTLAPYAIAAVLVLVLGGRWLAGRQDAAPASPAGAVHRTTAAATTAAEPQVSIPTGAVSSVVDVAGAVRRPGVYRLRAGARVRDALLRAGGATHRANTAAVNLAAKITDGQQILVPERAPGIAGASGPAAAGGAGAGPPVPVSLNGATLEQLDALQGVGPSTAQKILEWRAQSGGFASVDDLAQIPGIGPKKLEALRPQVTP
ncbi:MAG TPA: helix-hairpin-helix domain-containing protein [Solirubrobacteraceae bacterium]